MLIDWGRYNPGERILDSDFDGGLFVIKHASEKGLPVLAYCTACLLGDVREKASELGAKVLFRLETDAWLNEIRTFFQGETSREKRRERKRKLGFQF